MIDRDRDADKLALAGGLGVLPVALAVLGCWLWPLFNAAGSSIRQDYKVTEILVGFVGGGVIGLVLGATLLYFRSKLEAHDEQPEH